MNKFYAVLEKNPELLVKLKRLKVSDQDVVDTKTLIEEMRSARSAYLKEKGESEDATQIKEAALDKMDDWMSEFYAVAKIAMEDHPQLLESLGKPVRS